MTQYAPKIPAMFEEVRELERLPYPIVAFCRKYPHGHLVERHRHDRAQLTYALRGIMRVDTVDGIWVVPPMRALWIPPEVEHELRTSSPVSLRTLFIKPQLRDSLPAQCSVVEVTPLLRELILRMIAITDEQGLENVRAHMIELILDEIRAVETLPLHVPMPSDSRALRICKGLLQDPADTKTCSQWGASVGASSRTLERLFQKETGVSFGSWRRQARLLAALGRLAEKTPVSTVAYDLGYESASAFTAMFRRTLGRSPSEFFPQQTEAA